MPYLKIISGRDLKVGEVYCVTPGEVSRILLKRRGFNTSGTICDAWPPSKKEEPKMCGVRVGFESSEPTILVALAFYGLARHAAAAERLQSIFTTKLTTQSKRNYKFDVFLHANIAEFDHSSRSGESGTTAIDPLLWTSFSPCFASTSFQEQIDTEISRLFENSYREYGSAWKDDTHGGVLKNLLRALKSMRKVKEMIVAHEQSMNFTYDVVIGSRLDVFWTHAVPAEGYQNRNHSFCTTRLSLHLRLSHKFHGLPFFQCIYAINIYYLLD
jgi:hypothetical protein